MGRVLTVRSMSNHRATKAVMLVLQVHTGKGENKGGRDTLLNPRARRKSRRECLALMNIIVKHIGRNPAAGGG